jgi:hypothetical protein
MHVANDVRSPEIRDVTNKLDLRFVFRLGTGACVVRYAVLVHRHAMRRSWHVPIADQKHHA